MSDDFFWCPHCQMYTIDTWTPDDIEDRCPICGHIRPDDSTNLEMEFPLDPYTHNNCKSYRIHDGKKVMEFEDDRTPYFVRVDSYDAPGDPRYLVMDAESMVFALGDTPDASDNGVVRKVVKDPNMRFNGNGPTKISYTTNPGYIASLNLRSSGKSAKGFCPGCERKVKGDLVNGRACCPNCGSYLQPVKKGWRS